MICHKLAEWKCTHTHKLYMEEETQNIHKEGEVKAQNQFLRFPSIYLKQNLGEMKHMVLVHFGQVKVGPLCRF